MRKINDITGEIVDSALKVHTVMGPGLYEKVYRDCLAHELRKRKIEVIAEHPITVQYDDLVLSNAFKIDLLVDQRVVVELKSVDAIAPIHEAQILTYMRLSSTEVGLLINFNVKLIKDGIKRFRL